MNLDLKIEKFYKKRKIEKKEYLELVSDLTMNSRVSEKLNKLYLLNLDTKKRNDNLMKIICDEQLILTAYGNLQTNHGALSKGVDPEDTVDGFSKEIVKKIQHDLRNGCHKWKDIKRVEIPKPGKKKKRPLGLPVFSDKIVQEMIRIVLNTIYEPIFQEYEVSHGSRPKRSTHTAMKYITPKGQGLHMAIEGDITGAFPNTNHEILLKILEKKIYDKRFLELIRSGLKHSIIFEGKKIPNTFGLPQGSIASPILFNIYMHEFDQKIQQIIQRKDSENKAEGRRKTARSKPSNTITMRIFRTRRRMKKVAETVPFNQKLFRQLREKIRADKKLQLTVPAKNMKKTNKRLVYCRYVDDWILLTNEKLEDVITLKEEISEWLKKELNLDLDLEKTHITNLNKGKAKFLGFTIFKHIKKVSTIQPKTGTQTYRKRSNELLLIGIDHERVKERLRNLQLIDKKGKTRHVGLYCSLKPWQIVSKFKQKIEGFANYYHPHLSYKSDLSYSYYVMKYSCLKTISYRTKKSISQILKTFGPNIKMNFTITTSKEKKRKEKNFATEFPSYMKLMDTIGTRTVLNRKKNEEKINFEDIFAKNEPDHEPVNIHDVKVNLRSGLKTYFYCTICGAENTKSNPTEMHHIKHIRKGKVKGFSQVMKSLGRKRIPVCKNCHRNIHKGEYNDIALKDLFDPDFITT